MLTAISLSAQGVNYYSQEKEAALGAQLAADVRQHSTVIASPEIQGQIDRIGRSLGDGNFTFTVIADDPSGRSSAYEPVSLPGGAIFVSARLILAARDEAELAGMLAHAMAHISARHGTRLATQGASANLTTIPIIFAGGTSGIGGSALLPIGLWPMQRAFELEADSIAVASMAAAGYDPRELVRYINREQGNLSERMRDRSAMPSRQDRVTTLERELPTGVQVPPATDRAGFPRLQQLTRAGLPAPTPLPTLDQPPRLLR